LLHHALPVYPNLAREMVLTGIDQLWRADITYVRLETEFVDLDPSKMQKKPEVG